MTTDIERQFFNTFGIEPYDRYYNCIDNLEGECKLEHSCCVCDKSEDVYCYPEITDRILLELIRLGLNYDFVIHSKSVEELKEKLLALLMYNEAEFKQQVQALFKGNDNV